MYSIVSVALTILSCLLLLAAFSPLGHLATQLPAGVMRTRWRWLALLAFAMLVGQLAVLAIVEPAMANGHLLAPLLLLLGSWFVCAVSFLSWRAVQSIQRMPTPDRIQISEALAGLHDRKSLDGLMRRELQRADRHGVAVSVLLLDVDDFAAFNRAYGRTVGDLVLTEIGRILAASVRATDVLVRYDDEEIAVVAPHIGSAEAMLAAERLRRDVEVGTRKALREAQGARQAITVSIGVAGREAGVKSSVDLLAQAHAGLQQAKREGGNRCVLGS